MKRWREISVIGLLGAGLFLAGCDTPAPPPQAAVQNSPATEPEMDRPTTQALLSGPYQKLTLPDMPLSLRAPESWKFSSAAHLQFIEGPTPHSQASIQFARREPIPDDRIEALIARLKGESADPTPLGRAEMRQVGAMRVLERIFTSKPLSMPKLDLEGRPVLDSVGNPVMTSTTPVHWSVIAFIPEAKVWNQFELNVIGLSTDQFEKDKPLLEKVFNSLTYESGINVIP